MKFSQVTAVRIPKGAAKIRQNGKVLWRNEVRYVSLGDSIAADSAGDSQYGVNGNTETKISDSSYTNLIRKELQKHSANVKAISFARSGDTVADLMEKLTHERVQTEIKKADFVTVCIGANDVLGNVTDHLGDYLTSGDSALEALTAAVNANIAILADDSNPNSYAALFNKLESLNPNARYVFTAVYNPYKYLWVDEGKDGFFGPLLDTIPQMTILGFDVDEAIKEGFLSSNVIQTFFDRANGLGDLAETYVTSLNAVLREKIAAHDNFKLAESKTLYEAFPDRPVSAPKHYNDLINMKYTRGWDMGDIHWGRLWDEEDEPDSAAEFWWDLVTDHVSTSGVDLEGIASEFLSLAISKVIYPDIDPHPEDYGQYVLKRSFTDTFGWEALDRHYITYAANGGTGTMETQMVVGVDGLPSFTNIRANAFGIPAEGYRFVSWNTAAGGGGTSYSNGQFVGVTSDMKLFAQWSNIYTVTFRHSYDSSYHGSGDTGPMECYALWIDGVEQADLGAFSNPARTYRLPYGTPLGVIAAVDTGSARSYITVNGTKVAGNSNNATYDFLLKSDVDINFEWNYFLAAELPPQQSYWNCYITTH